jgi:tetratricopeptide (TPR) repeat protein
MGLYTIYDGEPEKAVALLDEALSLLSPKDDPRLVATVRQNRLLALTEAGRFAQASALHLQSDLRRSFGDDTLNLLQLRVLEAKILAGLGKLDRAASAFEAVHDEFLARDRTFDAALVGLELAEVWLRLGKTAKAREIAAQKVTAFQQLGVDLEVRRALDYLHKACQVDAVNSGLIASVRRFVARSQWREGLLFKAG